MHACMCPANFVPLLVCGMPGSHPPHTRCYVPKPFLTKTAWPTPACRQATSPVRAPAGGPTRPASTSAVQALIAAAAAAAAAAGSGPSAFSSPTSPRHIPGAVRVFGGLRVRMGVHSGVTAECVSYSRVAARTQYSGSAMDTAKAVCDAAQVRALETAEGARG